MKKSQYYGCLVWLIIITLANISYNIRVSIIGIIMIIVWDRYARQIGIE